MHKQHDNGHQQAKLTLKRSRTTEHRVTFACVLQSVIYVIAVALLAVGSISFANTAENTTAPETDINLTPASAFTSVRNLPVIVKNEVIADNTCRLSFENGSSRDVPCHTDHILPEAVAAK